METLAGHAQIRAVRECQPEQIGIAEGDLEPARKIRNGAGFLLVERRAGSRKRRAGDQPLEPTPPRAPGRWLGLPGTAAAPAPAAAARARSYARAFRARAALCPPNPNEFETAARTLRVRA